MLCTNIERLRALLFLPRFLGLASIAAEGEISWLCQAQRSSVISPYALFSFYGSSGAFLRQRPVYPLFAGVSRCYSDTGFSHFVCFNLLQVAQSNEIASYMSIKMCYVAAAKKASWHRCDNAAHHCAGVIHGRKLERYPPRRGEIKKEVGPGPMAQVLPVLETP